jgi:hypothetical protein
MIEKALGSGLHVTLNENGNRILIAEDAVTGCGIKVEEKRDMTDCNTYSLIPSTGLRAASMIGPAIVILTIFAGVYLGWLIIILLMMGPSSILVLVSRAKSGELVKKVQYALQQEVER